MNKHMLFEKYPVCNDCGRAYARMENGTFRTCSKYAEIVSIPGRKSLVCHCGSTIQTVFVKPVDTELKGHAVPGLPDTINCLNCMRKWLKKNGNSYRNAAGCSHADYGINIKDQHIYTCKCDQVLLIHMHLVTEVHE